MFQSEQCTSEMSVKLFRKESTWT